MRKKILMVILTFSVLILPGFASAARGGILLVQSASHSSKVNTPAPAPEDEKGCAQHLADLLNEGKAIVETTILADAVQDPRAEANIHAPAAAGLAVAFHLSNASSRDPKAAIIVCRRVIDEL